MDEEEWRLLLKLDSLHRYRAGEAKSVSRYKGFQKDSQSLEIGHYTGPPPRLVSAILRDGDKIVAQFDAEK
jgi:hypothetical protein